LPKEHEPPSHFPCFPAAKYEKERGRRTRMRKDMNQGEKEKKGKKQGNWLSAVPWK